MDLYDEFLGLIDALEKDGIDHAVCGGVALAIHGHPRFTKDIDILIRSEDLDRVRTAVGRRGFTIDGGCLPFGAGGPLAREVHRVSKVEGSQVLTLDLLLVSPALEDAWRGREMFAWRGRRLRAVSVEGLAMMKRLAGRSQDLVDLESLGLEDRDEGRS
jgi:hypothetical protein